VRRYHAELTGNGIENVLVEVPAVGHSVDFSRIRWAECLATMTAWLDKHLAGPG
jgi:hypothetical protein